MSVPQTLQTMSEKRKIDILECDSAADESLKIAKVSEEEILCYDLYQFNENGKKVASIRINTKFEEAKQIRDKVQLFLDGKGVGANSKNGFFNMLKMCVLGEKFEENDTAMEKFFALEKIVGDKSKWEVVSKDAPSYSLRFPIANVFILEIMYQWDED